MKTSTTMENIGWSGNPFEIAKAKGILSVMSCKYQALTKTERSRNGAKGRIGLFRCLTITMTSCRILQPMPHMSASSWCIMLPLLAARTLATASGHIVSGGNAILTRALPSISRWIEPRSVRRQRHFSSEDG